MSNDTTVLFSLDTDAFPATRLEVTRFRLRETLDDPYEAEIRLAIYDVDADVLELLGRDVVVSIARGDSIRRVCGVVRAVRDGEWAGMESAEHLEAHIDVVPGLWMLGLRRNTRMFQEMSVPDIVEAVLGEALEPYGRSARLDLSASYPTREYCMQYQETDLEFVARLLSEEGIFFTFDHEGEREVMVLRDSNGQLSRAPSPTDPIAFRPRNSEMVDEEGIVAFLRHGRHGSTSVAIRDFDWTSAAPIVEDTETGADEKGRDRESYEHGRSRRVTLWSYDAGARSYQARDVATQKTLRLEEHAMDSATAHGASRVSALAPGTTFELSGHPHLGLDGEYYVTAITHIDAPFDDEGGAADRYHNLFECRPVDVPHRPRRRFERPTIPSVQTAIVTGPAGEEIHTDEHGRIKVQFHWDRDNPADETSSCWIRCEQDWSAAGWGFWWLPRIGMEVVVHFVDGDPDKPLVTGCVYNGDNRPPYPLPDEKTKSTIKSNSSIGGDGSNELRFEDKAGSEEIYKHAEKDENEIVLNDHTTTVHHDQTNTVDNDQTQIIGVDQTEIVHGNQQMSVGGNRTVHVKGDFEETVDGTETRHTVGDVTESFGSNETRSITATLTETISGSETRDIGANKTETVGGSHTLDVAAGSARSITGSLTQNVVGGITENAPAGYNITATGGFTITIAGSSTWTAPGGIKAIAPGGVTWVDANDSWFGTYVLKINASKYDECFPLKFELGDMAVGVFGVKIEQAGLEVGAQLSKKQMCGTQMVGRGVLAAAGGLRKAAAGLISRGG